MAAHDPDDMNGTEDDWRRVRAAIDERMATLPLSWTALYDLSMSETTYRKMADGIGVSRPSNRAKIARALGWTDDSIDRILAGGPPIERVPDDLTQQLADVASRVESLERWRAELLEWLQERQAGNRLPQTRPPGARGQGEGTSGA